MLTATQLICHGFPHFQNIIAIRGDNKGPALPDQLGLDFGVGYLVVELVWWLGVVGLCKASWLLLGKDVLLTSCYIAHFSKRLLMVLRGVSGGELRRRELAVELQKPLCKGGQGLYARF